jgi:acyl carrier protein
MLIHSRLNGIFQEIFDDPTLHVTPETGPADIADWDSVAQMKLVLAMEEAFGVQLATEEVACLSNVGDFLKTLRKRGIGG